MNPDARFAGGLDRERGLDLVGLVAFSVPPVVALYQGIVSALGLPIALTDVTATVLPLIVIGGCFILRLPSLPHRLANPSAKRATIFLLAYLLTILVSTSLVYLDPIERDPARMMRQFFSTAAAAVIFLVMVTAPSLPSAIRALRISIVLWALAAVITPLTALTPFPIGEVQGAYEGSQGTRSFGVLGDGGTFVVSFLAVAFFISRKFVWFALAMLALIFSGSRSALVVAAAGLAAAFVLGQPGEAGRPVGGRAIRVIVAALAAALALIVVQIVFGVVAERIGAINAFERLGETEFTNTDRFFSIEQGLEWFWLSPVYGNGFNSYFYFSLRSAAFGANQSNALNQIVQTLVDGGLLGLIFLGLFFFEIVRPAGAPLVDRRHDPFGMRVWLLVFLVLNQTAVYILPAFWLTMLIFGVCGIALHAREVAAAAAARRRPLAHPGPAPGARRAAGSPTVVGS